MSVANGIVTMPCNVAVIGTLLGQSKADIFTVCASSNINKWAKYKSIGLASLGLTDVKGSLTEAQRQSANYGLLVPQAVSQPFTAANEDWIYKKPVLGTDWARLDDFFNPSDTPTSNPHPAGYLHNASAPIYSLGDITLDKTSTDSLSLSFMITSGEYVGQIAIGNLPGIANYYPGIAWTDGESTYVKTSANTCGSSSTSFTLLATDFPNTINTNDEYYYVAILSSVAHTSRELVSSGLYLPMPLPNKSDGFGKIAVNAISPITVPLDGLSTTLSPTRVYIEAAQFENQPYIEGEPNNNIYFTVASNGDLFIRLLLTNDTTSAASVSNEMYLTAVPTLVDGTGYSGNVAIGNLYDANLAQVSSISVPARTSVYA